MSIINLPFGVSSIPDCYRTDNTNPLGFPPKKPSYGSYCIRSSSEIVNNETDESVMIFKGYDTDVTISDRVLDYCDRKLKMQYGDKYHCTEPIVSFTHSSKGCDGRISVFDNVNKSMYVVPGPNQL